MNAVPLWIASEKKTWSPKNRVPKFQYRRAVTIKFYNSTTSMAVSISCANASPLTNARHWTRRPLILWLESNMWSIRRAAAIILTGFVYLKTVLRNRIVRLSMRLKWSRAGRNSAVQNTFAPHQKTFVFTNIPTDQKKFTRRRLKETRRRQESNLLGNVTFRILLSRIKKFKILRRLREARKITNRSGNVTFNSVRILLSNCTPSTLPGKTAHVLNVRSNSISFRMI